MTGADDSSASPEKDNIVRRFARSRKGVAMIEFGMVSIPFLGLLCAIFETAFVFFVQASFDDAVTKSARAIATNQYSGVTTVAGFMAAQPSGTGPTFCQNLPSFITCGNVYININPVASWSAASVSPTFYQSSYSASYNALTSTNAVNLGTTGSVILFQAFYAMPVYLSVLVATNVGVQNMYNHASNSIVANPSNTGFVHAIFSTAAFRNEP